MGGSSAGERALRITTGPAFIKFIVLYYRMSQGVRHSRACRALRPNPVSLHGPRIWVPVLHPAATLGGAEEHFGSA